MFQKTLDHSFRWIARRKLKPNSNRLSSQIRDKSGRGREQEKKFLTLPRRVGGQRNGTRHKSERRVLRQNFLAPAFDAGKRKGTVIRVYLIT